MLATAAVAAALFVALAGGALAGGGEPQFTPPQYLDENIRPGASARHIYLRDCAYCHGAEGQGTNRGTTLRGVGRASVHYWVSTGRMPINNPDADINRNPPSYPPETVAALVDYVAGFTPGGPDIPSVDLRGADLGRGLELFSQQCAACHAWSGVGGALLYREAPEVLDATPTQIAEAIRVGPGNMPAFGRAALSDEQLNDVVAYTNYLKDPRDRGGNPLWHLGPFAEGAVGWMGLGVMLLGILWIGARG